MIKLCRAALIASAAFLLGISILLISSRAYHDQLDIDVVTYQSANSAFYYYDRTLKAQDVSGEKYTQMKEDLIRLTNIQLDVFFSLGTKTEDSKVLYSFLRDFFEVDHNAIIETIQNSPSSYVIPNDVNVRSLTNENFHRDFDEIGPSLQKLDIMIFDRAREKHLFLKRMERAIDCLMLALAASLITAIASFEIHRHQQKTPA